MTAFAQRLRELKAKNNISFPQISEKTGISISVLFRYASGKTEPRLPYLIWLADYFGVSLDYLAGRDGP